MTDRIPLDHLTSDQYDQLHAELEHARAEANRWAENESADAAAGSYARRAEEAEQQRDQLAAALREVLATFGVFANGPGLVRSGAIPSSRLAEWRTTLAETGPATAQATGPAGLRARIAHTLRTTPNRHATNQLGFPDHHGPSEGYLGWCALCTRDVDALTEALLAAVNPERPGPG